MKFHSGAIHKTLINQENPLINPNYYNNNNRYSNSNLNNIYNNNNRFN